MPKFFDAIWMNLSRNPYPFKGYENPKELRDEIHLHFILYSDTPLPDLRLTPKQYFASNYANDVPNRNRQPLYNLRNSDPYYADTYHDYISFMTDGDAQVDELVIAFTAFLLGLNLTVYIQSEQQVPTVLSFRSIEQMWFPTLKVCISFDGANFQLIDPPDEPQSVRLEDLSTDPLCELVSMGFSIEKAGKSLSEASGDMAAAIENLLRLPRITLPDPDDLLLFGPEMAPSRQGVPQQSFGYTQCDSPFELLTSTEQFYDACKSKTSSESFPVSTEVPVCFNDIYCNLYHDHLFGSFMLGEKHDVRYRVVSFTMMDRSIVAYHGSIENLSRKSGKHAFFSQLSHVIHRQDVISVRIARLN